MKIQKDPNHISLNNRILIEAHYKNISRPSLKILLPMHHLQDDFDKTWKLKNQSSDETDDDDTGFSSTSISRVLVIAVLTVLVFSFLITHGS